MPNEYADRTYPGVCMQTYQYGTGAVVTNNTTPAAGFYSMMRSSVRTPGFHNPKRVGLLPMNAFTFTEENQINWHGELYYTSPALSGRESDPPSYWNRMSGTHGGAPTSITTGHTAAEMTTANAVARNKLLAKIKDQSVNLAQVIAEREQTINLVTSTATRVGRAIVNLRRGNFAAAAGALGVAPRKRGMRRFNKARVKSQTRSIASGWLELQYGWKPLLNDVYGACEALAKNQNNIVMVRSSASHTLVKSLDEVKKYNGFTVISTGKAQYTAKYVVYYSTSNPSIKTMSSLGLINPLVVAWELVPWSFVVDWFLPIGNWLGTLDATSGLSFQRGSLTTFHKFGGTAWDHFVWSDASSYTKSSYHHRFKSNSNVTCVRTSLGSFPSPAFPAFKNPVSVVHMANAVALLSQLFLKK